MTRYLPTLAFTGILALTLAPSAATAVGIRNLDHFEEKIQSHGPPSHAHHGNANANYHRYTNSSHNSFNRSSDRPSHPVPEPSAALVFGLGLLLVRPVISRFRN